MIGDGIKQAAAVLGAIIMIGGVAWAFGENTGYSPVLKKDFIGFISKDFKVAQDTTQQLVKAVQWIELENLEKLYATSILDDQKKQKRCLLAYQLQAFYIKDCNWPAIAIQQ